MAEDSNEGKDIPSSIPNLFFDIIARIIPGSIFIGLYFFKYVQDNLNTPTISFTLLCSYYIGIILNTISNDIWRLVFFNKKFVFKVFDYIKQPLVRDDQIWTMIYSVSISAERMLLTKQMSEEIMFRSTSLIFFSAIFAAPSVTGNFSFQWYHFVFAFLITSYCMIKTHISISKKVIVSKQKDQVKS